MLLDTLWDPPPPCAAVALLRRSPFKVCPSPDAVAWGGGGAVHAGSCSPGIAAMAAARRLLAVLLPLAWARARLAGGAGGW